MTTKPPGTDSRIRFILQHGILSARYNWIDNMLTVFEACNDTDGNPHDRFVNIENTSQAVRNWLGY